ncbi:MAG: hypothetical protein O3C40_27780 [Planctomycetota bacterium]|nr:hypothetical protein [Planctomycetota bacterium]
MTSPSTLAIFCVDRYLFLAGQAQYIHMGRRFRRGGGRIDWTELLIPIALIAFVVGTAWLVSRYLKLREQRNADSPQALFAELCRAHELDWANQQLLRALANAHRLPSPAQLFVEPERFNVESLGSIFENRRTQIVALRSRLFAGSGDGGPEAS